MKFFRITDLEDIYLVRAENKESAYKQLYTCIVRELQIAFPEKNITLSFDKEYENFKETYYNCEEINFDENDVTYFWSLQ